MATSPKARPVRPRRSDVNQSPPQHNRNRHDSITRKDKGKQKAVNQDDSSHQPEDTNTAVIGFTQLLNQSFTLHSVPPLHNAFNPTTAFLDSLAASLRSYLSRQLPSLEVALVQATFVPVQDPANHSLSTSLNLIQIQIQAAQYGDSLTTSSFILIPSPSGPGGRKSNPAKYPLLLTKTPTFPGLGTSLLPKFIDYLASRHDAQPSPLLVPSVLMTTLLETLVATVHADRLAGAPATDTRLTWAFPPALAQAGLASMTVTLPPPLVESLLSTVEDGAEGGFCGALSGYLERTTGLGLDQVHLAKLAVGGVLVHSGLGTGGVGGGAGKVKFVGTGEVHQVLVALAGAVEDARRA